MTDMGDWRGCSRPELAVVHGRYVSVEPFNADEHDEALFAAIGGPGNDDLWRYIPFGPLENAEALGAVLGFMAQSQGWKTHILRKPHGGPVLGMASYMRIRPEAGSAEVGAIVYSHTLQRKPAATEAMYLMARHLFDDLGYRRYEWKCHDANDASKRAAIRLGFTAEGVFRQDMVVKGENRDTAWFSIIDREWPQVKAAFEAWLAPENFGPGGQQLKSLGAMRGT